MVELNIHTLPMYTVPNVQTLDRLPSKGFFLLRTLNCNEEMMEC